MATPNPPDPKLSPQSSSHNLAGAAPHSPPKATIERRQSGASLSQHSLPRAKQDDKPAGATEGQAGAPDLLSNSSLPHLPPGASPAGKGMAGPSVINKQLLSKLNKSLKEKQKTTAVREPLAKNPTLIQDVLSTSPSMASVANISGTSNASNGEFSTMHAAHPDERADATDTDMHSVTSFANATKDAGKSKKKGRKMAKQNSTRTDFFAARLASAVDDIESSDSDETFVYETNANEFGVEDADLGSSTGANLSPPAGHRSSENINHAPSSIQIVHDNISTAGSLRNVTCESNPISPVGDARRDDDKDTPTYVPSVLGSRAESIHSIQSSRHNFRVPQHATPPATNGRDFPAFSDPFLDSARHQRQPTRKNSCHSILSEERKEHPVRSPHSPYGNAKQTAPAPYGLPEHMARPYQDGLYAYGEEDVSGDEGSSQGDAHSIMTDSNANTGLKGGENLVPSYKSRSSNKPSTVSSKLRSTTSKLFDRKGPQPRRYSTIPDDIDIEDFDDELIYYDNNNARFPYNNHGSLNENAPLMNGHKLPHHRSLNLNFNGKRAAAHPRNTRYVSLGYAPPYSNGNKKNDVFPFPYPESRHSFYGFDEFDEETQMQLENDAQAKHLQGRSALSPNNPRFLLPHKASHDQLGSDRMRIFKSVLYTLIGIIVILSIGFVSGFLLASTKELSNLSILSINHATVSQDELIFNVDVEALNPGWLTISVSELELDVFAKSGYLDGIEASSVETVLLGTVSNFESALRFEGGFFDRQLRHQTGEIKLIGPGKNFNGSHLTEVSAEGVSSQELSKEPSEPQTPDNSDKWAVISKHPFDLILRGVIKYNLPWTSTVKTVVVNKVGYIDPLQTFEEKLLKDA